MSEERHKYEYEAKPDSAAARVAQMVGAGKRVLELGSGPGSITRILKKNQCRVTALEMDVAAIEAVSQFAWEVFSCDLNDVEWPARFAGADKFEVIVAGDVLEHLHDPWATLQRLQWLLAEDGHVVVSLPNAGHNAVVACLLAGDFDYQSWGLLDKTHIRFFGIKNIQKLFEDAGLKIVEAGFVVRTPEQTEFANHWRQLAPATRQALAANEFGTIYQVVVKAVPVSATGKGLRLASLPVPSAAADTFINQAGNSRPGRFMLSFLGFQTRKKIAGMLRRAGFRF